MKKVLLLFLLLVLSACGAETTTETAVNEATDSPTPEPTAQNDNEVPATAVPAAAGITPATTAAEASVIRSQDHVIGASDPAVTIIEYGDFQ